MFGLSGPAAHVPFLARRAMLLGFSLFQGACLIIGVEIDDELAVPAIVNRWDGVDKLPIWNEWISGYDTYAPSDLNAGSSGSLASGPPRIDSAVRGDVTLTPGNSTVTLIRDLIKVPNDAIQALSAAGAGLTESVMDSLLTSHIDFVSEYTIRGVVLTDPLKSGLAIWDPVRGGPTRVHLFIRDPAADSLGNEAMNIQLVDDAYEAHNTLSFIPGEVIEVTGHLMHFANSVLFIPTAIVDLGYYTDLGLSDAVVASDTFSTGDVNQGFGSEMYQANWANYNMLKGSYICIERATMFRRTPSLGRPDWAITSDGGASGVTTYDMSLRFRNDQDAAYQAPFDVLSTDFVPPPLGSVVTVCGTVEHQPFNDPYSFSVPDNASLSLVPWSDDDLIVSSLPPLLLNLQGPTFVPGNESVQITIDAIADPLVTLDAVKLMYAVGPSPTVVDSITMNLQGGDTYSGSIPSQGDGAIVKYWVEATDSSDKKTVSATGLYRHLYSGITRISDIQETFDGGEGASPLAGMTTSMDITAIVQSDPATSGFIAIQDDTSLGPWSGIIITPNGTLLADLATGDQIHITHGTIVETSSVTGLSNITYSKLAGKAATTHPYKEIDTANLKVADQAEAHEGMLVLFSHVKIVEELSFGEWRFTNGSDDDSVLGDGASSSFPDDNSYFEPGERYSFLRGIWWFSFGTFKLVPEDASDVGDEELLVDAKVFLQGPYAGGAMDSGPGFIAARPTAQPYSDPFFNGTPLDHDNPDVVSSPPDSVLDWVLVSLRSDPTAATEVVGSQRIAFLLENGSIVDTSGALLAFPGITPDGYHLVVRHRNHASVMSADTLDLSDGIGSWDFTTSMAQAYSTDGSPMKNLGDGRFGMFACDANADGQITAPDFNMWNAATTAGETGYRQADCNMDGQVAAPDFNLWNANTTAGASSKVPD